jgi:membrane-bound lytic murein transglycosylase B
MKKCIFILFVCIFFNSILAVADNKDFQSWLSGLKVRLLAEKISEATIEKYLPSDIELIPKLIALDRNQPEYKLSFDKYYSLNVNERVKKRALELFHEHKEKLLELETKYKVDSQYIIALWAIESRFGENLGKYPTINALVTLSHDGRRPDFFEGELTILLKLIDTGKINAKEVIRGSWAGALGHFQFMPSSCDKYGIDHNGNGHVDLHRELEDALASAANYLSSNGWQYKAQAIQKVTVPDDFDLASAIEGKKSLSKAEWKKLGITTAKQSRAGSSDLGRLITLEINQKKQPFLVYSNFDVILHWNKSNNFAASVSKLASYVSSHSVS